MTDASSWWEEQGREEGLERYTRWGRLIKTRLYELDWTDQDLAEKVNLSKSSIGAILRGERPPPPTPQLIQIADVLGLDGDSRDQYRAAALSYTAWRPVPATFPGLSGASSDEDGSGLQERLYNVCLEWCRRNPETWAITGGLSEILTSLFARHNRFEERFTDDSNRWIQWTPAANNTHLSIDNRAAIRDGKLQIYSDMTSGGIITPERTFNLRDFSINVEMSVRYSDNFTSNSNDDDQITSSLFIFLLLDEFRKKSPFSDMIRFSVMPKTNSWSTYGILDRDGMLNSIEWGERGESTGIQCERIQRLSINQNGNAIIFSINDNMVAQWPRSFSGKARIGIDHWTLEDTYSPSKTYTEVKQFAVVESIKDL